MIEPRPVPGRRTPERRAEPPRPPPAIPVPAKKPRRWLRRIGWLFLLVVLWCGWAGYAVYDLSSSLDTEDAIGLERRVDWSRVREGLRDDLRVMLGSPSSGEMAADSTVDPLITQRAIVALVRSARLNERGWEMDPRPGRGFDLLRIRYAFFTGGPFAFRVDLKPDSDSAKRPLVLLFRWTGDWRLTRVFLPGDAFGNTPPAPVAPAAQPSAPAAPSASAPAPVQTAAKTPPPPDAQRVMLYEEDPTDPNGKSYQGWVVWRAEPSKTGNPADAAIICQVAIPDRPMSVTLTMRRNADRALPASHTIDVKFDIPANSPTQGVLDVAGIMMKPNEEASGQQLAGTRVKVSKDIFLMGLSAIDLDVQQNMQILKDRPWIGIPFVYGAGQRAVLSIEKGETGSKIINDTVAQWTPPAPAAASTPAPAPEARGQRR
ncbi:DUF2939 domain-containing protein [Rhodoplanes sp. Z2-YC6860]|uniref:DUF2939 domain-containing protein n=1 Tax=Rhodoplanes sp. Z2-YC6860 TaxID=674703 RepID=UPI000830C684|nr:DUF2939 domain-containing protein [Rhodoplanes sp. Z2-YC6860]